MHLELSFSYQKFWDEQPSQRQVQPYALKEFKNRWYILAKDNKDNVIKSFALDRISELEITKQRFTLLANYDANSYYRNSFGIISPNGDEPKNILLSFNAFQGKYIKTLPLHATQTTVVDNDEELQISLCLYITHDFVMEILSFGANVRVLAPVSLIKEVKKAYADALQQYIP
ncbi:helix-turn-helix transcriptional regulator [Mucilaginibacter sp.]